MTRHRAACNTDFTEPPTSRVAVESAIETVKENKSITWEELVKRFPDRIPHWENLCQDREDDKAR